MATDKQIEANRRNAQKSTGPKTPEGKRRSSQNARTHGLFSTTLVLDDEDALAFQAFETGIAISLQADDDPLALATAHHVAAQLWRVDRSLCVEAQAWRYERQRLTNMPDPCVRGRVARETMLGQVGLSAKTVRFQAGLTRGQSASYLAVSRLLKDLREQRRGPQPDTAPRPRRRTPDAQTEPDLEALRAALAEAEPEPEQALGPEPASAEPEGKRTQLPAARARRERQSRPTPEPTEGKPLRVRPLRRPVTPTLVEQPAAEQPAAEPATPAAPPVIVRWIVASLLLLASLLVGHRTKTHNEARLPFAFKALTQKTNPIRTLPGGKPTVPNPYFFPAFTPCSANCASPKPPRAAITFANCPSANSLSDPPALSSSSLSHASRAARIIWPISSASKSCPACFAFRSAAASAPGTMPVVCPAPSTRI